jgi:arabinan endo-1,5-alpha-L-arabinosidase
MNGNAFVGPGHNFLVEDLAGRWWTFYHAVDRFQPYFAGAVGFTKRPLMLDAVDWDDGWPSVRGGAWISDTRQQGPAAQAGGWTKDRPQSFRESFGEVEPGAPIRELSDEFTGTTLGRQWSWVRPPAAATYSLTGTTLRWDTQTADLFESSNSASVLVERAPRHDYVVETKVALNVPPEGCCFNYTQAGALIYGGDDSFVKLVHFSLWDTRQTEFAKEWSPVPAGWPRYGNTVVGPPGDWTYLRIARCERHGEDAYIPYTSRDGTHWARGGTWTHELGDAARIGLVSMGRNGDVPVFTASFDYVRVYSARGCARAADAP